MDIELGDTGVTVGDAADATKAAGKLAKSLPGMTKKDDDGAETSSQVAAAITKQPGAVANAIETGGDAADCCSKAFDCFGKGMDAVDKVQAITGEGE